MGWGGIGYVQEPVKGYKTYNRGVDWGVKGYKTYTYHPFAPLQEPVKGYKTYNRGVDWGDTRPIRITHMNHSGHEPSHDLNDVPDRLVQEPRDTRSTYLTHTNHMYTNQVKVYTVSFSIHFNLLTTISWNLVPEIPNHESYGGQTSYIPNNISKGGQTSYIPNNTSKGGRNSFVPNRKQMGVQLLYPNHKKNVSQTTLTQIINHICVKILSLESCVMGVKTLDLMNSPSQGMLAFGAFGALGGFLDLEAEVTLGRLEPPNLEHTI